MNIQRSHGMDIDAYVKYLQNGEGKNIDLEGNMAEDSNEDDRANIANKPPIPHQDGQPSAANISQNIKPEYQKVKAVPQNETQSDMPRKDKQILISELDSSHHQLEHSVSDMSGRQQIKNAEIEKQKQMIQTLMNRQFIQSQNNQFLGQSSSTDQLLNQMRDSLGPNRAFDINNSQLFFEMSEKFNRLQQPFQKQFDETASNQTGQKKLKLSPSKIQQQTKNVQNLRTARWANQGNLGSSQNSPNDPKMSSENSPQKIPICEETYLSLRNLNLRNLVQFENVWDLISQKRGTKYSFSQMYSNRLYQKYPDLHHIMEIPDILYEIKNEVEEMEQIFNMDAIKIDWHLNKNELFVNDFKDKIYERKQNGAILILNLFEKSYQSNKTQKVRIRNMQTKQLVNVKDLYLQNGTLITLKGKNVDNLSYEVPKVTSRISEQIGKRITITFYQLNPIESNPSQNINESSPVQMAVNGKTPSFGKQRFPANQLGMNMAQLMDGFLFKNINDKSLFQNQNQNQNKFKPNNYSIENFMSSSFNKLPSLLGNQAASSQHRHNQRERAYSGYQDSIQASTNKQRNKYNEADLQQLKELLTKKSEKPSPNLDKSLNHSIRISQKGGSPQESSNSYNLQNQYAGRQGLSQRLGDNSQKPFIKHNHSRQFGQQQQQTPRQKKLIKNSIEKDQIQNLISILTQGKSGDKINQTQRTGEASPISQVSRQNLSHMLGDPKASMFQNQMKMYGNSAQRQQFSKKNVDNIKMTEQSGTPSEHRHAKQYDDTTFQLIKAMMAGKGPAFPQRGISEISGRSGMSMGPLIERKFQPLMQKPQASRIQKDSGEQMLPSHNIQILNQRKDQYQHEELSRRPSQLSNLSSFLGMQQVVGDRHTSNGANEPDAEAVKPNHSDLNLNDQTLHSVQQMLNQQCMKQVSKLMSGSPQKVTSIDLQQSVQENQQHGTQKKRNMNLEGDGKLKDSGASNHITEFSDVIKCIETKKNFLYFQFINNVGKHFQQDQDNANKDTDTPIDPDNILSESAVDFLQSYNDIYVQIQEKQLKLFIKALMFYSENEKQNNKNHLLRLQKNMIDNNIIKNMVETLNIQILIKIVLQLYEKLKGQSKNNRECFLSIDQISPIKMDFFQQLIPQSYTQELNENYQKSAQALQQFELKEKNASQDNLVSKGSQPDFDLNGSKSREVELKMQHQKSQSKMTDIQDKSINQLQQQEDHSLSAFIKNQNNVHKIKPGLSKEVSERRVQEKDSDNSNQSAHKKRREVKQALKETINKLELPQNDRFSFNTGVLATNKLEPTNLTKQISFQPTDLEASQQKKSPGDQTSFDNTFKQIANSLSPDPQKLIQQQFVDENERALQSKKIEQQVEHIKDLLGKKRAAKKQPGSGDVVDGAGELVSKKQRIGETQDQQLGGQNMDEAQIEPNEESAEKDFQSVIKHLEEELGEDFNIDQLIQSLMVQNKDLNSKMSELLQDPRLNAEGQGLADEQSKQPNDQMRRLIHEKTRGVRPGGFRQVAYSDNHQEIAQKQNSLSHEINTMAMDPQNNQGAQDQEMDQQNQDQEQEQKNLEPQVYNVEHQDSKEGPRQPQEYKNPNSPNKIFKVDKNNNQQRQKSPSKIQSESPQPPKSIEKANELEGNAPSTPGQSPEKPKVDN